jgi:phosphoribosylanthranilate isomerase
LAARINSDMTFVKICGITRLSDAQTAVRAGANAVGFMFAASPRRISALRARRIGERLHPAVRKVGVFVDERMEVILDVSEEAGLDGVQLHGSETPEFVGNLRQARPNLLLFKAISPFNQQSVPTEELDVDAVFLDPKDPTQPLAPVEQISYRWIRALPQGRYVVAGGLTPANVGELVRELRPWGVDVSRGVETAPGKKDLSKVREFVWAVRRAESEITT